MRQTSRHQRCHFLVTNARGSLVLPLKKMTKCGQRPNTVANDLSNRQHGHGEDRARNTPHPEPEDERDDDEDRIKGETFGQKHRR